MLLMHRTKVVLNSPVSFSASARRQVSIATLTSPANHVYGLAFSPSGAQLAATSFEGTVHLWNTSPADALSGVCTEAGQLLTEAEWESYVPGVPYHAACP